MKKIISVISLLLISLLLFSCSRSIKNASSVLQEQKGIVHAAGEFQTEQGTVSGTNSMEAFDYWYEKGYRIFELDFNFTTDNDLACVHDWGADNAELTSMDTFLSKKTVGGLTPMNLDMVAKKLKQDPGLFIVTDIKEDNIVGIQKIAAEYPELRNQFIIQIYHYDEYEPVADAGFKNILLTVYAMSYKDKTDAETIAAFAMEKNLFAITFREVLCEIDGYVEELKRSGVPLLVHTVNEHEEQEKYFALGIDGIYADHPPLLQKKLKH